MGETVRHLPLACEWEEIPKAHKAHIFPTLELGYETCKIRLVSRRHPVQDRSRYLDEVVPSTNRPEQCRERGREVTGWVAQLPAGLCPQGTFQMVNNSRGGAGSILRQKDQEPSFLRKQTAEAQQRAYLLHEG
ncbi:hypothetical protein Tco_0368967 [Tanacetum coccineum]